MEDLERLNNEINTNFNMNENTDNQNNNNIITKIDNLGSYEKIEEFIDRINNNGKIEISDFNLFIKIKKDNLISPLMIYILENAIVKCNNKLIDNGIDDVGTGYIAPVSYTDKENYKLYPKGKAIVLYATFKESFIGDFWKNHPLLQDLLGVNPDRTVLNITLRLGKSINESKSNKSKSNESDSLSPEDKLNESNNKEYYKLSLGANFEYNALHFLLYGIDKLINLPRIIYYPIANFIDYEEIDNAFIIEEMKPNLDRYYLNFKYIDLDEFKNNKEINLNKKALIKYNNNRKKFNLKKNDLVFIETTFEFETKKNKVNQFFKKIIRFIFLYIDVEKIENLSDYTIKPIILYNNDYNLNETNFNNIKSAIEEIKIVISNLEDTKFDKTKLNEIYNNLQIIYCWPTIPIFNNSLTYNELKEKNKKIDDNGKEIENLKMKIEKYKMENDQFKMKTEKYIKENEKNKIDILYLKEMIENLKYENGRKPFNPYYNKRFNKRNNNRYNNYKYYNNKPNYHNAYSYKYNDENNVNKKNYVNNNNYYVNINNYYFKNYH